MTTSCACIASFFVVLTVLCNQVSSVKIIADIDPRPTSSYFKTGDNLKLSCSTNGTGGVSWFQVQTFNQTEQDVLSALGSLVTVSGGTDISFRTSGKVGGQYICRDKLNREDKESYFVNVLDADALIPRNVTTNGTDNSVTLICDQRLEKSIPLFWTRFVNGSAIILNSDNEDKNYTVQSAEKGYALLIKNKDRKRYPLKTGEYVCNFKTNTTDLPEEYRLLNISRTVSYQATPDVRIQGVGLTKSKSATKDETFILTCVYAGNNSQPVVWKYSNETVNSTVLDQHLANLDNCPDDPTKKCTTDGYRFSTNAKIENESRIAGNEQVLEFTSVLEFKAILEYHRGKYSCHVFNEIGENLSDVEVKVKDKLAALWPFLGIVAEVVLLCGIIFIYEKRRNKTVDEEDENEPMKGDVTETREDVAVRSRK